MRDLILRRQRALACFALPYFCVLDGDSAALVEGWTPQRGAPSSLALRNGERMRIALGEETHTLFVAVCTEQKVCVTETVVLPSGAQDEDYTVVTDYDGCRRLQFRLVPTAELS